VAWLWWLGVALLLAIGEVITVNLVLLMFAGGALAGCLAAALGAPVVVQALVAVVTAVVLLAALRPWMLKHLRRRAPLVETNAAALVGRSGVAVSAVTAAGGRAKIGGEVWTARTETGAHLDAGVPVRVARIDGATAVVEPIEE
jgi:membrane protein implicated in regulation of membrane protease activity